MAATRSPTDLAALPLIDFIPAASPHLVAPRHLLPYVEKLDNTLGQSVELVVAAPPQHGKTEATKHALCKWQLNAPRTNFYYLTYSQERSDAVAGEYRILADAVGLQPEGRTAAWKSQLNGSRVMFSSIGGAITGYPGSGVFIVDDPIKGPAEARSKATRDAIWRWLYGAILTRRHPGSSLIVMATRWHPDDPSGRLVREYGFPYINIQAICEDAASDPLGRKVGAALWPEQRPLEFLEQMRTRDPNQFAAMYQGDPRPEGGRLFQRHPSRFVHLPNAPFVVGYGADLAYTAKTQADRSACLRALRFDRDIYFTGGISAQVAATEFTLALAGFIKEPRGPVRWYIGGGGEKGVAQFMVQRIPLLNALPATTDKYVRATPMAEAWNEGRIHVPDETSPYWGPWVEEFLGEIAVFTGVNDPRDDHIDAGAAAYDEVMTGANSDVLDKGFGGIVSGRWASGSGDDDWDDD